jgi:hypothetical protein
VGCFCVLVPLVLRSEDFEGEEEWDGGCLGRDILREGWGLHGDLHGEVGRRRTDRKFEANGSLVGRSCSHVTGNMEIYFICQRNGIVDYGIKLPKGVCYKNISLVEVHQRLLFTVGVSLDRSVQSMTTASALCISIQSWACSFVALFPLELCQRSENGSFVLGR